MQFYSGKGDKGKTSLINGKRIFKDEIVFELLGTLDELSAYLGLAVSFCENVEVSSDLKQIQLKLSSLMALIAGAKASNSEPVFDLKESIEWVEQKVHFYGESQSDSQGFVMPGKTTLGASLDVSRTVARRAERAAVRLSRESVEVENKILVFLNRLSSLLFFMRLFVDN